MKRLLASLAIAAASLMVPVPAGAASAEQEQAFVDAYKAAAALHPLPSSAPLRRRSMP